MSYGSTYYFGGLALIAGALVGIIPLLGILNMLAALFTVQIPKGFTLMNMTGLGESGCTVGMSDYEVNLLYIAGVATMVLLGAACLSVDQARAKGAEASGA